MNTIENNKLIAKFMGNIKPEFARINGAIIDIENCAYSYSWDWLIPVVEKIENTNNSDFIIEYTSVMMPNVFGTKQFIAKTKIEAVYNACVTFIEWYNKQTAEEK